MAGRVVINEVLYDADSGTDTDGEWVELYNAGETAQDLAGWSLSDAAAADTLPARVLEPRSFVIVAASDSFNDAYPGLAAGVIVLGGRIGNALGNDGDRLVLRDASGTIVDAISWGSDASILDPPIADVPAGHSIERNAPGADTDTAADFIDNDVPSPGKAISPPMARPQRQQAGGDTVDVIVPKRTGAPAWLPWAVAAAAGAGLVLTLSWRMAPVLRQRLHFRG